MKRMISGTGIFKVYLADADIFNDEALLNTAVSSLPLWRRESVLRIKNRNARNLSVAAYILAEKVKNLCGISGKIQKDSRGKPYIDTSDLTLSVSHSGSYAAVLLSEVNSGVDIEKNRPEIPKAVKIFNEEIRKKIITPADFMKYWTCYEAHIKCGMPKICFYKTVRFEDYTVSVCSEKEISHLDIFPLALVPSDFSENIAHDGI